MNRRRFCLAGCLFACLVPLPSPSWCAPRRPTGWRPLMDGYTFAGWHMVGDGLWTVESGSLVGRACNEKLYGLLVSKDTFRDFRLRLRYKSDNGDSGVYIRTDIQPPDEAHGLQIQVGPIGSGNGGIYESYDRGWLVHPTVDDEKRWVRPGDCNDLEILASGGTVEVRLNGTVTAQLRDDPGRPRGHIALQMHSGTVMDVRFRDIQVWENP